jgi:REP element-mobilizing transposase RayT
VTQRGNARQQVFHSADDYALYKDLLWRYAAQSGLNLWAYCLMPNHIHLICAPKGERSLAAALGRTHADYARHFNLSGNGTGNGGGNGGQYPGNRETGDSIRNPRFLETNCLSSALPFRCQELPESWRRVFFAHADHAWQCSLLGRSCDPDRRAGIRSPYARPITTAARFGIPHAAREKKTL